jgi:hypothetical protein
MLRKTFQCCHPEQQRRISLCVFSGQCEILRRLLAPQNDSSFGFFRSLFKPQGGVIAKPRPAAWVYGPGMEPYALKGRDPPSGAAVSG